MHEPSSDLILINGKVILMDRENTIAEAIAIKDGKIYRAGSTGEMRRLTGIHTKSIDLSGRVVIPGFIDCHTHVDLVGMMNSDRVVNCRIPPLGSVEDIMKKIGKKAEEVPRGELILGQSRWIQP
jgi:predicted amidohydrolase YtcJ